MNIQNSDQILQIKRKALALREASEDLEYDTTSNPFNIVDVRNSFNEVLVNVEELKQLLDPK